MPENIMPARQRPEIVSFNLTDLDARPLDIRLELSTVMTPEVYCVQDYCPQDIICPSVICNVNTGCNCNSYTS
jgi:hypothetical protein